jgi:lipopolysaccharide transport system ATP-binding protein
MSSEKTMIRVKSLGKAHSIRHAQSHSTLVEHALDCIKHPFRRSSTEIIWVLRDINIEINLGDIVGLVGHNGAGKSSLLKILSRVAPPTTGTVELYGRVGSLLEVGTGFHPELSGRENIFLNGSILGMRRREILQRFDDIVEFAGVETFLDTPVKRYSSGMYVRLAFSVASHLQSDILLVDEVLSVGDAEFQSRSLQKMQTLVAEGRTIIYVSHNLDSVLRLCNRAVILDKGSLIVDCDPPQAIRAYKAPIRLS